MDTNEWHATNQMHARQQLETSRSGSEARGQFYHRFHRSCKRAPKSPLKDRPTWHARMDGSKLRGFTKMGEAWLQRDVSLGGGRFTGLRDWKNSRTPWGPREPRLAQAAGGKAESLGGNSLVAFLKSIDLAAILQQEH